MASLKPYVRRPDHPVPSTTSDDEEARDEMYMSGRKHTPPMQEKHRKGMTPLKWEGKALS